MPQSHHLSGLRRLLPNNEWRMVAVALPAWVQDPMLSDFDIESTAMGLEDRENKMGTKSPSFVRRLDNNTR